MRCVLFFLCMAASYSVEAKYNNNALLKNTGKAIWLLAPLSILFFLMSSGKSILQ